MRQPTPSNSESWNSSMVSSLSSALCYRQTAPRSVTGFHQMPPVSHGHVIEMEPQNTAILSTLVAEKSLDKLARLGGLEGIKTLLNTDLKRGILGVVDEISSRISAFRANSTRKPPTKSFFCLLWEGFKDKTILILLVCGALSLGFDINGKGPKNGWYDGGSIFLAVFLVVFVTAIGEFRQGKRFNELSDTKNNILVDVVRDSKRCKISKFDIVAGDVVSLKIGDQVPADGLFIEGHSLLVDESTVIGQRNLLGVNRDQNPFLLSGSKVVEGYATMLVTCVEMNSITSVNAQTPLQELLKKLTSLRRKIGLAAGFLILVVLLARYFTGKTTDDNGDREFDRSKTKAVNLINDILGIISIAATVMVVAIPVEFPCAVALSLAYSMKKMMVRNLAACEVMGSATIICTDSACLLSNEMKVTKSFIGKGSTETMSYTGIAQNVLELLVQGISLTRDSAQKLFTVTPLDDAIHEWAVMKMNMEMDNNREGFSILGVKASSSDKKRLGVLVKRQSGDMIHVNWRGDFERISSSCSHYYDIDGDTVRLDDQERDRFRQMMENEAESGLQWIALAHKLLSEEEYENERANHDAIPNNLILLGIFGLKGHCRSDTKQAIEIFQQAGVHFKMITGDSVSEAKAIALECGILSSNQDDDNDGRLVTGEDFRSYQGNERLERAERIRVLARSSPDDKVLMVQALKDRGHVVAVTADGTNYVPALKEADIGLAMGILGTEVEKENSDIINLDDNFDSLVKMVRCGRCVYDNIQKFMQFQLTLNVAALIINFVAAASTGKTPFTPAQFLWVNLIMGTFGALALAAEKPREGLMKKQPVGRSDPLINNIMLRNILGQSAYQIAVVLALYFKGESIFNVQENVVDTLIFTNFFLLQVFNQFNARELEKMNVFEGILKNMLFLAITGIATVLQVIMVEFLNEFAHTERLDWKLWGVSIGIAAFSWAIAVLVKFVPVPKRPMLS